MVSNFQNYDFDTVRHFDTGRKELTDTLETNAKKICDYAYDGAIPDGVELTIPGRALFYSVKDMYSLYKAGRITAQNGAARKRVAIRQYEIDTGQVEGNAQLVREHADRWAKIEAAASAYARSRTEGADAEQTILLADKLYYAIYNIVIKADNPDKEPAAQITTHKDDYKSINNFNNPITETGGEDNAGR